MIDENLVQAARILIAEQLDSGTYMEILPEDVSLFEGHLVVRIALIDNKGDPDGGQTFVFPKNEVEELTLAMN